MISTKFVVRLLLLVGRRADNRDCQAEGFGKPDRHVAEAAQTDHSKAATLIHAIKFHGAIHCYPGAQERAGRIKGQILGHFENKAVTPHSSIALIR